jgi:NAD(P)H-hydrate repair Nnr-like enzyme with NAD(P)H-hydrate epimerase domain
VDREIRSVEDLSIHPGNTADRSLQGGDGLVAARHLHHFRYKPTIYLPKPGSKEIYQRLLKQCENLNIPVINDTDKFTAELKSSNAILDAVFGISLFTYSYGLC